MDKWSDDPLMDDAYEDQERLKVSHLNTLRREVGQLHAVLFEYDNFHGKYYEKVEQLKDHLRQVKKMDPLLFPAAPPRTGHRQSNSGASDITSFSLQRFLEQPSAPSRAPTTKSETRTLRAQSQAGRSNATVRSRASTTSSAAHTLRASSRDGRSDVTVRPRNEGERLPLPWRDSQSDYRSGPSSVQSSSTVRPSKQSSRDSAVDNYPPRSSSRISGSIRSGASTDIRSHDSSKGPPRSNQSFYEAQKRLASGSQVHRGRERHRQEEGAPRAPSHTTSRGRSAAPSLDGSDNRRAPRSDSRSRFSYDDARSASGSAVRSMSQGGFGHPRRRDSSTAPMPPPSDYSLTPEDSISQVTGPSSRLSDAFRRPSSGRRR